MKWLFGPTTYVVFENNGSLDERSITTFGVSSKDTENPIGFFGTGLKYAIAILLRNKQEITIHSNDKQYFFDTKRSKIRNDEFDVVRMNDVELGFTTQLGKTWEMWQAFRELYSNCLDEQGKVYLTEIPPVPEKNKTYLVINGSKFVDAFNNRYTTFLPTEPLYTTPTCNIHPGQSSLIYYKGVRAYDLPKPSMFSYDIKKQILLTEDRTIRNVYDATLEIRKTILLCTNKDIIKQCVTANKSYIENEFDYAIFCNPSSPFLQVVGELSRDYNSNLNPTALKLWLHHAQETIEPQSYVMTSIEVKQMEKAIKFCKLLGFDVTKYEIVVSEFLGEGVLGRATNNKIYVSKRTFMMGTKMLAGTILEEYIHLKYKLRDETRDMQNFLFDLIISLGEQHILKEPL